jgi:hypothetical protein
MMGFDYAAWFGRATTFTQKWDRSPARVPHTPVCSEEDLQTLATAFGKPLPSCVLDFFRACGIQNRFHLWCKQDEWLFYGGAEWHGKNTDFSWIRNIVKYATPEKKEFFTNMFPLFFIGNGDYIVLNIDSNSDNPSVGYFAHDDESIPYLCVSFTQFLTEWERCCYADLDSSYLEPFRNAEGILSSDTPAAIQIREYFGEQP